MKGQAWPAGDETLRRDCLLAMRLFPETLHVFLPCMGSLVHGISAQEYFKAAHLAFSSSRQISEVAEAAETARATGLKISGRYSRPIFGGQRESFSINPRVS